MSRAKPSSASEPRKAAGMLPNIQAPEGTPAAQRGFVQLYATCEQHGQYPRNTQDAEGYERWFQPGCPSCRRQSAARALMRQADISPRFAACTFENYRADQDGQRHALKVCRDYADQFADKLARGVCMILRGNPGTGKNHLSSALMMHVMQRGHSAMRIKAQAYLDAYWSQDFGERDAWMTRMARVDLLVIDEIGRASNSKAANDAFFRLLDERYENMRPTIVISNLDREGLRETLGPAAYDRLTEGGGNLVNFDWSSHRAKL